MQEWIGLNQQYLSAQLARLRALLARRVGEASEDTPRQEADEVARTMFPARPALTIVCEAFGLSAFERDVLLLCAGIELDSEIAALVARVQNETHSAAPTFSTALAVLPDAHWSALTPEAPLRYWRLIELGSGNTLTTGPLRMDERILHFLTGISQLDQRLGGIVAPLTDAEPLVPSQAQLAKSIATASVSSPKVDPPIIQLLGDGRALATAVCKQSAYPLYVVQAERIPTALGELETFIRLWEREAKLTQSALLVEAREVHEHATLAALTHFLETVHALVFVNTRTRYGVKTRQVLTFDVPKVTVSEQRGLWTHALGDAAHSLNGQIDQLVAQFDLDATAIQAAAQQAQQTEDESLGAAVWSAARNIARANLDTTAQGQAGLVQRIEASATWDDIVLPQAQLNVLRNIAAHVRQRHRVYDEWGWGAKSARGLGITALFAGASGTGKTMAAEVLANELRLDLYRIDLSAVVSKYIGETEKNLARVFDAAEAGGAILLFDEADALFGKRSEVQDSHDRYANIEISYLLQRMEQYRGLAILTTNLQEHLDRAFVRRLRFIVQFPFPDSAQRAEIWRRIFPHSTPTEAFDAQRLARLNIAGGNIRNIALHASFLAADENQRVGMSQLLRAAQTEYAKLNKTLTEGEIREWSGAR